MRNPLSGEGAPRPSPRDLFNEKFLGEFTFAPINLADFNRYLQAKAGEKNKDKQVQRREQAASLALPTDTGQSVITNLAEVKRALAEHSVLPFGLTQPFLYELIDYVVEQVLVRSLPETQEIYYAALPPTEERELRYKLDEYLWNWLKKRG